MRETIREEIQLMMEKKVMVQNAKTGNTYLVSPETAKKGIADGRYTKPGTKASMKNRKRALSDDDLKAYIDKNPDALKKITGKLDDEPDPEEGGKPDMKAVEKAYGQLYQAYEEAASTVSDVPIEDTKVMKQIKQLVADIYGQDGLEAEMEEAHLRDTDEGDWLLNVIQGYIEEPGGEEGKSGGGLDDKSDLMAALKSAKDEDDIADVLSDIAYHAGFEGDWVLNVTDRWLEDAENPKDAVEFVHTLSDKFGWYSENSDRDLPDINSFVDALSKTGGVEKKKSKADDYEDTKGEEDKTGKGVNKEVVRHVADLADEAIENFSDEEISKMTGGWVDSKEEAMRVHADFMERILPALQDGAKLDAEDADVYDLLATITTQYSGLDSETGEYDTGEDDPDKSADETYGISADYADDLVKRWNNGRKLVSADVKKLRGYMEAIGMEDDYNWNSITGVRDAVEFIQNEFSAADDYGIDEPQEHDVPSEKELANDENPRRFRESQIHNYTTLLGRRIK